MSQRSKNVFLYVVSLLVVAAALLLTKPAATVVGVYWCVSFWALVIFDAAITHGEPGEYPMEDRILGYIFSAPFIWPARIARLYGWQLA